MSTDSLVSFAALIYDDPGAALSYLVSNSDTVGIGFDAGEVAMPAFANYTRFILDSNSTLASANIFRIDGKSCALIISSYTRFCWSSYEAF